MEQQQHGLALDRQAFDRSMLEHLPSAQRFAIRLCGNADDAEDIVQEALSRAARSWRTYSGRSSFRTWLFQVVVNSFRDHVTSRGARDVELSEAEHVSDSHSVPPLARLETDELAGEVARQVSCLPPRQREVLVLSVYEDLTTAEIALALEISAENVRVNLHLARQRLRETLKRFLPETHDEAR